MKMLRKIEFPKRRRTPNLFTLLGIFFLFQINCFAQIEQYNYKSELTNITDQWHQVILPTTIFGKVKNDLSDIRIYGITATDTIEAPYILQHTADETIDQDIKFKLINESNNENGYFFTFEIKDKKTINHIDLIFQEKNFNQVLKLEGSQNQKEWFTIVDDYRILSIKNEITDYTFSTVKFPDSKYKYFRVTLKEKEVIKLNNASVGSVVTKKGNYNNYSTKSFQSKNDKKLKQTIVDIDLGMPVTVSQLEIDVAEDFDFYRPVTIQYLSDSTHTPKGWKYHYRRLTSGTLTSLEKNNFQFSSTTLQKLKIIIHNHDNEPLQIKGVNSKGYVYELVARFNSPANYFLAYGNKKVRKPKYDISRFSNKIPNDLVAVNIGQAQYIGKEPIAEVSPLFENKIWLWIIMGIVIVLLGGFTLSMISKKEKSQT